MDPTNFVVSILGYVVFFSIMLFCCIFAKVNVSIVSRNNQTPTQHAFFEKTLGGKPGISLLVATAMAFVFVAINSISTAVNSYYFDVNNLICSLIELIAHEVLLVGSILLFVGEKRCSNKLKSVGIILSFVFLGLILISSIPPFISTASILEFISSDELSFFVFSFIASTFKIAFITPSFIICAVQLKYLLSFAKGKVENIRLPKFLFIGILISYILYSFFYMCAHISLISEMPLSTSIDYNFLLEYYGVIFSDLAFLCSVIALPIVLNTIVNSSYKISTNNKVNPVIETPSKVIPMAKPVDNVERTTLAAVVNPEKTPLTTATSVEIAQHSWQPLLLKDGTLFDSYGNIVSRFKERRSLFLNIIFSSLTLFILPLVTGAKMINELNHCRTSHGGDRSKGFVGMMLFFSWLTLGIAPLIWGHRVTRRYGEELKYRGIDYKLGSGSYWVLFLLLSWTLVCPIIFLHKIFKASRLINAHHNKFGDRKVDCNKSDSIQEVSEPKKDIEEVPVIEEEIQDEEPIENITSTPEEPVEEPIEVVPTPVPNDKGTIEDRLAKAKKMLDDGVIDEPEYKEIRANILKDL